MAENIGVLDEPVPPGGVEGGDTARGIPQESEQLLIMFYDELRRLARARIARLAPGLTLTPTELVHDVYLRMVGETIVHFEGRQHFFFVACRAMRDVLVENARRKASRKRGGDYLRIDLEKAEIEMTEPREDILALNQALEKLADERPDGAWVVQLRYFGGLTVAETSEVMGCSQATVKRRWSYARAWLQRELSPPSPTAPR